MSQLVVGIDGCPGGWVAVATESGRFQTCLVRPTMRELVAAFPFGEVFAIDIPLSFATADGYPRPADAAARRRLGRKSSSLFSVPPLEVLTKATHQEASHECRRLVGKGVTRQAYALRKKILEVDDYLRSTGDPRFIEVHPEVSFLVLSEEVNRPITATNSKKSWNGFAERLAALQATGMGVPLKVHEDSAKAGIDDVLDAAVAAWTAQRVRLGNATSFPADPERLRDRQANGGPCAIWA